MRYLAIDLGTSFLKAALLDLDALAIGVVKRSVFPGRLEAQLSGRYELEPEQVEDMLRDSQRLHARQRLIGFDLIRSNPQICGYNLTGLLDHALTGEGLWSFWREWKPGILDALVDGWAPLRWCLFCTLTQYRCSTKR